MNTTTTNNLIVPEVIADLVETKLGERVTLLPLAVQDHSLQGQPGDTLKFPAFRYIGKADEIAENGQVIPSLLTSFAVPATVKKYAKAVQVTDEARLSGYGDPLGEAATQLAQAIDHAVDDALFAQLDNCPFSRIAPMAALSADAVADAMAVFGEDLDGPAVLVVDAAGFASLRKDPDYIRASDLGQRAIFSGIVGEIWGCQILISNKVKMNPTLQETRCYIVKPGALRLVNKQGTFLEVQRDAEYMRDNIFASKHCAAYLYDPSKMVALSRFNGLQEIAGGTPDTIHTIPGSLTGTTRLVIPDQFTAPASCAWVYILNTAATHAATFGTVVSGTSPFTSSLTNIPAGSNTYAHLYLVDTANKPLKKVSIAINKAP